MGNLPSTLKTGCGVSNYFPLFQTGECGKKKQKKKTGYRK